jgi:soluble lytic murein transglycosylase
LNFYSTIAKEKIGAQKNSSGIVFFDEDELLSCKNTPNYDDAPFVWLEYRSKLKTYQKSELTKLLSDYSCKQNGALYIAGLEKKEGYKKDYFPILYKRAFVSLPPYRKALYHAIARQESFFVPGVVSSAYAVGVMQIIPELGGELAQKHGESLKIKELFEPDKNIRYASSHFKWLEDMVAHPTLIAVSYNAGYGFFKRIEREGLFGFKDTDKLRYEPYWSIENIPYDETREYAKKVTLNYAVYSEYFNPNAENSLLSIVENLVRSRRR